MSNDVKLGFVGVGTMGGPMVRNLLEDGFRVTVNDIDRVAATPLEALGAVWAATPREAAHGSDIVMSSLPGPREVEAAALGSDGILAGIDDGAVYIDLSTSSPNLARKMHAAFKDNGANVLDAPVSGGESGAKTRKLIIMVGGDREVFDRCQGELGHLGDDVLYTGPIGSGSVCKLVHNSLSSATRMAVLEGLTLGVKAGVDPNLLWLALRGGLYGQLSPVDDLDKDLFIGRFDPPTFALKLAAKDVALTVELARETRVPVPMISLTEQMYLEAMGRGWGDRDWIATDLLQEERAGIQVRIAGAAAEQS
jgi:3-hydroxyisobutyrate dehydrogenase